MRDGPIPPPETFYSIPGYNVFSLSRNNRKGGGLIFYVSENMESCKIANELSIIEDNGLFESLSVEITIGDFCYLTTHITGYFCTKKHWSNNFKAVSLR